MLAISAMCLGWRCWLGEGNGSSRAPHQGPAGLTLGQLRPTRLVDLLIAAFLLWTLAVRLPLELWWVDLGRHFAGVTAA
jgi:hypothetical protein